MADTWKAAILGLVQGLTEFLPISSSAHLLALRKVMGFEVEGLAFDLSVHLATLLAVLIYFRREIRSIAQDDRRWMILLRLALATLPIVIVGFVFKRARENLPDWAPVAGWLVSGTYLSFLSGGRVRGVAYADAPLRSGLLIGIAQALAVFPGISRSGSTITAALWLGFSRDDAAKFSFLLSIIAVALAVGDKAKDLAGSPGEHAGLWASAGIAVPVAFFTGLFAIHLLLRVVRGNVFHRFGWYNYLAAGAFLLYLLNH